MKEREKERKRERERERERARARERERCSRSNKSSPIVTNLELQRVAPSDSSNASPPPNKCMCASNDIRPTLQ